MLLHIVTEHISVMRYHILHTSAILGYKNISPSNKPTTLIDGGIYDTTVTWHAGL